MYCSSRAVAQVLTATMTPPSSADREVGDDPFGLVAHQDRDLVALADAERVQPLANAPHLVAERR